MSFHGKHNGVPCQNPNCALPTDEQTAGIQRASFGTNEEVQAQIRDIEQELEGVTFADTIESFSDEFDLMCASRHDAGALKYGPGKFLTVDTIEEALQEIADLANYARYTFIRLRILQESIMQNILPDSHEPEPEQGFVKAKDVTAPVEKP